MITRLQLRNWRSHLDSTFAFSPGVNGLIGIMGSGKTSVLQAMSFAFFGTFPQLQSKRLKLDDLIMKRPRPQDRAEVELDFHVNGKQYTVRRVVEQEKGTTYAELRENGELRDVTPQGVTAEVQRLLKIDYDLYSKAVYAEQDGMDNFLRIPKGQRMEHIDRMLKLDRFETARANAVALHNRLLVRRKERIRILADLEKEQVEHQLGEAMREKARREEEKTQLAARRIEIAKEREQLTRTYTGLQEKETLLHQTSQKLEGVTAAAIEIEATIRHKKTALEGSDIGTIREEAARGEEKLRELNDQLLFKRTEENARRGDLASMNTRFMHISKTEIPKISRQLAGLETEQRRLDGLTRQAAGRDRDAAEARLRKEQALLVRLETQREQRQHTLNDIKKRQKCPTCDSAISAKKRTGLIRKRKEEITRLTEDIAENERLIRTLEPEIEELSAVANEIAQLKERLKERASLVAALADYEGEVAALRRDINRCAETLTGLAAAIPSLETEMKDLMIRQEKLKMILEDARFVRQAEQRLADYLKHEQELKAQSSQLAAALRPVRMDELRKQLEQRSGEERELAARESALEERLQEIERRVRDLSEREQRIRAYRSDVERDEAAIAMLATFIEVLKATQAQLREEFVNTVNRIMQAVWTELYPYGDFPAIRLAIDNDYVLQLRHRESWVASDAVSGGERSIAVLALRIAFALAFIPSLKWLILDEPTHNLDRNAIAKFSEILRERITQFADQIFLITHEERIADGITGTVYRLERNKAIGEPTRVVAV